MTTLTGMEGLREAEGRELGVTDWHQITQAEVDAFADIAKEAGETLDRSKLKQVEI